MEHEIESIDARPPLTVEELEHWVAFGATWRLTEFSGRRAVVDMCQCTGELVERRVANDPEVLEYLGDHRSPDA